ncbi:thioredoxin-like domain-containing protein [Flavobacterium sp.]|uniref:thioredoxin-like domain-containing protein n=1 Tax=Flavobacterium sp. TaxID=239 RepID=UPI002BDEADD3|nr:thioredoxin-like domain-containing protein [Flavobacterium sp.]HSD05606.1 thioredoxin-like domain-containing protein [Flavobacterium sp.]
MKKNLQCFVLFFCFVFAQAQTGHEIKINLKNCKDTVAYLAFYQFDKLYIADTCKKVINGNIVFKGKKKLDKGVYFVYNQEKGNYFDFIVDDQSQKQQISSDKANLLENLKAMNSKQNENFFNYIRFVSSKNKEFDGFKKKVKAEKKADSTTLFTNELKVLNEAILQNDLNCISQNKGTYLSEMINLKMDKVAKDIPKVSNGRPDSIYAYNYYKKHFWDGVNFQDDSMLNNPFFANKIKQYFNTVVVQHPDTVCVEIDRMMLKTKEGTKMNMLLLAYFTQTYEIPKIMGMDKVFVYMVDNYFKKGKAKGVYDDSVIKLIIDRGNVLAPLQLGKTAPDLYMIDIPGHDKIAKMGFDTAKTSEELTKIYYDNRPEIEKAYVTLSSVKADYLILLFWDVDCSHCQKEVPKILELYHDLRKENKDVQVFGVYTQNEFDKYKKYIVDNKVDWINVYDGVHINNLKDKYDVVTTPVIYILDRNKVIKAKGIGSESIKGIIAQMEKEYAKK